MGVPAGAAGGFQFWPFFRLTVGMGEAHDERPIVPFWPTKVADLVRVLASGRCRPISVMPQLENCRARTAITDQETCRLAFLVSVTEAAKALALSYGNISTRFHGG